MQNALCLRIDGWASMGAGMAGASALRLTGFGAAKYVIAMTDLGVRSLGCQPAVAKRLRIWVNWCLPNSRDFVPDDALEE